MLKCAELFIEDLKAKELVCSVKEDSDGDVAVRFPYQGRDTCFIFRGEEGRYVSIFTVFESVPEEKVNDMYAVCNDLNATYRWLKFFVDRDNDLMVTDDAIVSEESAADECFELLGRRINILKEVKPIIMRALYF